MRLLTAQGDKLVRAFDQGFSSPEDNFSPHRAQNNAISARLSALLEGSDHELPLIDTVERVQGAERDVIIFGFTTSDRDYVTSGFLNNPNRFNVVMTRARKKLIVIGSKVFSPPFRTGKKNSKITPASKNSMNSVRKKDVSFFFEP